MRRCSLLYIVAIALMTAGCASQPWSEGALGDHCPVKLVPSDRIAADFRVAQHMRFTTAEGTMRVSVDAQKRDGRLEIRGTSALGTTAVELVQDGTKIRIDDASGRFMGIHPHLVLDALHRSLFIEAPGRWGNEEVAESQPKPGERVRAFYATDGDETGPLGVQITFEAGDPSLGTRPTTRIQNRWCEYEALILTR